ncbi:preprotein translocase subunit SecE [Rhodobium orientis]|uniref:Protein translocase subunit SecE n=2 Tax=Rhodobium TaxID=34016 RepID=A0A327JD91_9HYPH|nr:MULTISPECIES: preprotein translocase subunit SecE [Rhodobium]MBB4301625.1 preprotein translocase subunit SecE [Rhodobium orientis]MBK5952320.1 preprotein translocase subunit SecE [Rhodobium orientis]MCW2310272.1 preprotein translocase subunit SecE [Rhodobium gokarnense]RAI23085.1 preprotein translocase subunit SecE [Rhodobium orientis]
MAKTNPFTFIQQVRAETAKVSWPTRRETGITTVMVFVMVFFAAMFFLLVDQLLSLGVGFLLGVSG